MVKTKDVQISGDAFMNVLTLWWPSQGGLPEELHTIVRLAKDRGINPADVIFHMIRRAVATGAFDG